MFYGFWPAKPAENFEDFTVLWEQLGPPKATFGGSDPRKLLLADRIPESYFFGAAGGGPDPRKLLLADRTPESYFFGTAESYFWRIGPPKATFGDPTPESNFWEIRDPRK